MSAAVQGMRFELPGGARALFTSRTEGNLSSVGGDRAEHGAEARERLRESLGLEQLARGHQVHGTAVRLLREPPSPGAGVDAPASEHADGQATMVPRLGVLVLSADCIPVALAGAGAVAIVHAGWRGLAAGVLERGVEALRELGAEGELGAAVGPCAGPCCYEVGVEVHEAFAGAHRHGPNIDLRAIAHDRLRAAGVAEVADAHLCTICDERFFSHRREGVRAGRQGGVAWLS